MKKPPTLTADEVAEIIGAPFESTAGQCHAVSLAIVKSGRLPGARVARGTCHGVFGQHSWIVCGRDPYQAGLPLIDPTLWSYVPGVKGVYHGQTEGAGSGYLSRRHVPFGAVGTIWSYGRPHEPREEIIPLQPKRELSERAQAFLRLVGPLDRRGWMTLAESPVAGWPAAEIVAAMYETDEIRPLVPIDRVGMLTDYNPAGLYLPGEEIEVVA